MGISSTPALGASSLFDSAVRQKLSLRKHSCISLGSARRLASHSCTLSWAVVCLSALGKQGGRMNLRGVKTVSKSLLSH